MQKYLVKVELPVLPCGKIPFYIHEFNGQYLPEFEASENGFYLKLKEIPEVKKEQNGHTQSTDSITS